MGTHSPGREHGSTFVLLQAVPTTRIPLRFSFRLRLPLLFPLSFPLSHSSVFRRLHSIAVAACIALAAQTRSLEAQEIPPPATTGVSGSFALSGTVKAEATGVTLPYTTVSMEPLGRERFTDENGFFQVFGLTPGKYKFRVRQLGYIQLDTTVQLSATKASVAFVLVKVASTLAEVKVTAPPRLCVVPEENGYVADPELSTVLWEARKNAERERLLRRTYPFEYKLAQAHDTYDVRDSTHRIVYDTMAFRSDDDWKYRRGRVVSTDHSKLFGDVRVMRLPTLIDLADQRFLIAHCFKYSGISDEEGAPAHRIDFAPLPEIVAPDVEGSIFIDSATYIIRRAQFRLTKGGSIKPAVLGMTVTTTYRQILPNVALFDEIESVQPLTIDTPRQHATEFRQTQRLLSFRFLFRGPPGSERALVWRAPDAERAAPPPKPPGPER